MASRSIGLSFLAALFLILASNIAAGPRAKADAGAARFERLARKRVAGGSQEFLFTLFDERYLCRRIADDDAAFPAPGRALPTPPPAPVRVQVICDGEGQLVTRSSDNVVVFDKFSFREQCRTASEQFERYGGCYCSPDNTLKCVTTDLVTQAVGSRFSFPEGCLDALRSLDKTTEIRRK